MRMRSWVRQLIVKVTGDPFFRPGIWPKTDDAPTRPAALRPRVPPRPADDFTPLKNPTLWDLGPRLLAKPGRTQRNVDDYAFTAVPLLPPPLADYSLLPPRPPSRAQRNYDDYVFTSVAITGGALWDYRLLPAKPGRTQRNYEDFVLLPVPPPTPSLWDYQLLPAKPGRTQRNIDDYSFTTTSNVQQTPSLWDYQLLPAKPGRTQRNYDDYVFTTASQFVPNASLWDYRLLPPKPGRTQRNYDDYIFSTASNLPPNSSLWDSLLLAPRAGRGLRPGIDDPLIAAPPPVFVAIDDQRVRIAAIASRLLGRPFADDFIPPVGPPPFIALDEPRQRPGARAPLLVLHAGADDFILPVNPSFWDLQMSPPKALAHGMRPALVDDTIVGSQYNWVRVADDHVLLPAKVVLANIGARTPAGENPILGFIPSFTGVEGIVRPPATRTALPTAVLLAPETPVIVIFLPSGPFVGLDQPIKLPPARYPGMGTVRPYWDDPIIYIIHPPGKGGTEGKMWIGEIQQLGIGSVLDTSTGLWQ